MLDSQLTKSQDLLRYETNHITNPHKIVLCTQQAAINCWAMVHGPWRIALADPGIYFGGPNHVIRSKVEGVARIEGAKRPSIEGEARVEGAKRLRIEGEARTEGEAEKQTGEGSGEGAR